MSEKSSGRTIIITGASDGIGAAAARELAAAGENVIIVGRNPAKTRALAAELNAPSYVADFADLAQVRDLAAKLRGAHPRIDVLVNNAGALIPNFTRTVDGHEKTLQVNHLAPFLLTNLLMDVLVASKALVVNTSSDSASFGHIDLDDLDSSTSFDSKKAYGATKLENILFTRELHRRFHAQGVRAVAFNPGTAATNFASDTTTNWRWVYNTPLRHLVLLSPRRATRTLMWFLDDTSSTTWTSGQFYLRREHANTPNAQADDDGLARRLWERSAQLVDLSPAP